MPNEGAIIDMNKISIPISMTLSEKIPLALHMTTIIEVSEGKRR